MAVTREELEVACEPDLRQLRPDIVRTRILHPGIVRLPHVHADDRALRRPRGDDRHASPTPDADLEIRGGSEQFGGCRESASDLHLAPFSAGETPSFGDEVADV